jgi:hypothetical protein
MKSILTNSVPEVRQIHGERSRFLIDNAEALAACALACLYFALMSGHLESIDGLLMYRQAASLTFQHSIHFGTSLWWGVSASTSKYGLGLSLLYAPGLVLWAWLQPYVPIQHGHVYDWSLLYADPLYTIACAPVHVLIAAVSAYLVARFLRELGLDRSIALWGLALYGLASPAIVYARGDWAQPLVGLCWIGALLAALRFRRTGQGRALWIAAVVVGYAVLTRPVEGTLLLPGVLLLTVPELHFRRRVPRGRSPLGWRRGRSPLGWRRGRSPLGWRPGCPSAWRAVGVVVTLYLVAALVTLWVNWARYGSPFTTGYEGEGWTTSLETGLAGALVSPGWGILWEFPAALLAPVGLWKLWHTEHRKTGLVVAGLVVCELVNTATWHAWTGGWNWGLRLFLPALPLVAVLSASGIRALSPSMRRWVPPLLFIAGLVWVVPCIVTDLLGGYAGVIASGPIYAWRDYPPIGAWQFLHHWRASTPLDPSAVDILWFRTARPSGNASLIIPVLLIAAAMALGDRVVRLQKR